MSDLLAEKSIFITGGTGAFGRAFAALALAEGARRVAIFSRDEYKRAQMAAVFPDPRMRFFTGDIRDTVRLAWAISGAEIVIHGAAMKRIEVCHADPFEAVQTNVVGTQNVAEACIRAGVGKAVFLSTDKAPHAHTLYGATKYAAERLWNGAMVYAAGTPTLFAATRYGNVLGSTGSVLSTWRAEKAAGLPLTLTDAKCSRFWMTMGQAVDLVILALEQMQGGEVFIPKIGSAPLLSLARAVAEDGKGSTYAPGHIETGLRPGERLHETLISSDESANVGEYQGHYRILPHPLSSQPAWSYQSDTNIQQLSVEQLRAMIV